MEINQLVSVAKKVNSSLSDSILMKLINTFCYGGYLEEVKQDHFRLNPWQVEEPNSRDIPCISCKIRRECGQGNRVNPESCNLMRQWMLDF